MSGKSNPAGRRTLGSLLGAGGLGVLVLAAATACASAAKVDGAGGSSSSSSVPIVTASSPAASPSTGASPSGGASGATGQGASGSPSAGAPSSPGGHTFTPTGGGPVVTPKAQVSVVPAGKLTPFDSAAHSPDGMTLYLALESQGGSCGQYDVVVQQSGAKVEVGLVHLPSGGHMCPMYVTRVLIPAKLSAPLAGRTVVDLATSQVVASPVQQ